jgi:hypothetical protein
MDPIKFCAHNDARSWTNQVSNATLISAIDVYYHLTKVAKGTLPLNSLAPFLHECAHHWCFHSPVGLSLSVLYLRASRAARRILLGEDGSPEDVVSDLIKFEAVSELFRPLLEGMALFAEFDATPGVSSQLSPISRWAWLIFGPATASPNQAMTEGIQGLLEQSRLKDKVLNRKTDLLLQPLERPEDYAYVLGYMSIKNFWNEGIKRSSKLMDRDLFLCFIRSFFLEDYEIVALLLDPSLDAVTVVNGVIEHVQSHVNDFYTNLASHVTAFERINASKTTFESPSDPTWIEGLSPENINHGQALIDAEIKGLQKRASECEDVIAASDLLLLMHRELIRVASSEVQITISDHVVTCRRDDETVVSLFRVEDITDLPLEGPGRVMIYFAPYRDVMIYVVAMGDRALGIQFFQKTDSEVSAHLERVIKNIIMIEDAEPGFERACERVSEQTDLHDFRKDLRGKVGETLRDLYKYQAFLFTASPLITPLITKMKSGGFASILENDMRLLKFYSYIGILASLGGMRKYIRKACVKAGYDFDELTGRLKRIELRGVPLLVDIEQADLMLPYF